MLSAKDAKVGLLPWGQLSCERVPRVNDEEGVWAKQKGALWTVVSAMGAEQDEALFSGRSSGRVQHFTYSL